jgi:hypothetical protein
MFSFLYRTFLSPATSVTEVQEIDVTGFALLAAYAEFMPELIRAIATTAGVINFLIFIFCLEI